jgi:hypothetical protein
MVRQQNVTVLGLNCLMYGIFITPQAALLHAQWHVMTVEQILLKLQSCIGCNIMYDEAMQQSEKRH